MATTFRIDATGNAPFTYNALGQGVTFRPEEITVLNTVHVLAEFPTSEIAQGVVKLLPKFLKLQEFNGTVTLRIDFAPDGTNKGKNEAGLKRLRTLLGKVRWEQERKFGNSVTPAQFERFLRQGSL